MSIMPLGCDCLLIFFSIFLNTVQTSPTSFKLSVQKCRTMLHEHFKQRQTPMQNQTTLPKIVLKRGQQCGVQQCINIAR
jgi:hypothetical protein